MESVNTSNFIELLNKHCNSVADIYDRVKDKRKISKSSKYDPKFEEGPYLIRVISIADFLISSIHEEEFKLYYEDFELHPGYIKRKNTPPMPSQGRSAALVKMASIFDVNKILLKDETFSLTDDDICGNIIVDEQNLFDILYCYSNKINSEHLRNVAHLSH